MKMFARVVLLFLILSLASCSDIKSIQIADLEDISVTTAVAGMNEAETKAEPVPVWYYYTGTRDGKQVVYGEKDFNAIIICNCNISLPVGKLNYSILLSQALNAGFPDDTLYHVAFYIASTEHTSLLEDERANKYREGFGFVWLDEIFMRENLSLKVDTTLIGPSQGIYSSSDLARDINPEDFDPIYTDVINEYNSFMNTSGFWEFSGAFWDDYGQWINSKRNEWYVLYNQQHEYIYGEVLEAFRVQFISQFGHEPDLNKMEDVLSFEEFRKVNSEYHEKIENWSEQMNAVFNQVAVKIDPRIEEYHNSQQYKDFRNMYETLTAKIAEAARNEYLSELDTAGIEASYCPEIRYYDVYVTGAQLKSPETLPFGAYVWLLPENKAE